MKTLVLDRRGHCEECPPCDWTHGDGDRPSHCPRHAVPTLHLWDVELDCDHNMLVVADTARHALDLAEAFARDIHQEGKVLPYKTAVQIPLDSARALVMYPALEVTWR